MKPAVLVTGAAGFSGRHAVRRLAGDPRIALTATTRAETDLADPAAAGALVAAVRPVEIWHLAGAFSNDAEVDHRANVVTTANLLAAVRDQRRPCRVLLVGSAAEYGPVDPARCPVPESHPLRPTSVYGKSKARQTALFHAAQDLDVVMARPFNLVGDGLSPRLLLGRVQAWMAAPEGRLVLGGLDDERDYLGVEAAIDAYRAIVRRGRAGEVYNVGSGRPRKVREVVGEVLAARGFSAEVIDESAAPRGAGGEVSAIWADTRKLDAL